MIRILISLVLLIIPTHLNRNLPKVPDYILFTEETQRENHARPTYISMSKLDIKLDSDRFEILKRNQKLLNIPITKKIYHAFLNTQYNFVITDKKTYKAILDFVYRHKELYSKDKITDNQFYNKVYIALGKKTSTFMLLDENVNIFLNELTNHLKDKYPDEKVLNALNEL